METKVIVLYARPWSLVDDNTGKTRSGVSIHYLTTDKLSAYSNEDGSEFGYPPVKQSISVEASAALTCVPGLYNASMELRASKGQNILAVSSLEFISALEPVPESDQSEEPPKVKK